MKNITITRTKNTVSATYLPYAAYQGALTLADMLDGKIGKTAEGFFKADFPTATKAKAFVEAWTGAYEMARNERNAQKSTTSEPTVKKSETKPTASARKPKAHTPKKAKGNGIDFNAFKGTKSEKNRALHAMLVSMGMKDSRTSEYQAVWNARPWAN